MSEKVEVSKEKILAVQLKMSRDEVVALKKEVLELNKKLLDVYANNTAKSNTELMQEYNLVENSRFEQVDGKWFEVK